MDGTAVGGGRKDGMSKLQDEGVDANGQLHLWWFCPGCKCSHAYTVPRWTWNGSMYSPTFTPSLLCNQDDPKSRCHVFITDGIIDFLEDCYHELKGQKVPMQDWEGWNGG